MQPAGATRAIGWVIGLIRQAIEANPEGLAPAEEVPELTAERQEAPSG
jgi:hypothetical protein